MSPKLAEKMMKARDLKELRHAYEAKLNDPTDHHANHIFAKMRAYCLHHHGEEEVRLSLSEVDRCRKETNRA